MNTSAQGLAIKLLHGFHCECTKRDLSDHVFSQYPKAFVRNFLFFTFV